MSDDSGMDVSPSWTELQILCEQQAHYIEILERHIEELDDGER